MKKAFIIISVVVLAVIMYAYFLLFSSNTGTFKNKAVVYIPTGSTYENVKLILQENHIVSNMESFDKMARRMSFPNAIHPGKYQFTEGMGNYTMVQMLRGGKQVPVKLVINKLRTKNDIIKKICSNLEADSNQMRALFKDTAFLNKYQIDSNQIQTIIIPDTYQFYWNTDAKKAIEKIAKNYSKFWTNDRKQLAKKLNLTIPEVITLASIVEEETNMEEDKPKIASTYINRIRKGMPLQADPTLKFAVGNFALKRLLTVHTQFASPYNTYQNPGLPPGPICTPNTSTIDATLNAPETTFLYFCAREDFKGYSNFASTYEEHQQNARKYQQALNQRGIK